MIFIRREYIIEVLSVYLSGMPVEDIADYMESRPDDINEIIDLYAPYL